ncbi:MAG: hypothetical protein HDS04_06240 [Bacteroides sp.]|nr:hypothetical protein [Bacteroides sp.]
MMRNNTLKKLLSKDYNDIRDYDNYFAEIAQELMCNYIIVTGKAEYDIIDIEFYLYTPEHQDVITYPREMDEGRWFFHASGVDITFRSTKSVFGGILIRGLRKNKNEYIGGPQKCVNELWHDFDAFSTSGYPILIYRPCQFDSNKLWRGKRWIKIKEADRVTLVKKWSGRIGPDNKDWDFEEYIYDEFSNQARHLYRYIHLSEDEIKSLISAYSARPQLETLSQVCRNE